MWTDVTQLQPEAEATECFNSYQGVQGCRNNTLGFHVVDYFRLFMPDTAVDLIQNETNRYVQQLVESHDRKPHTQLRNSEVTRNQYILAFIALQIDMRMNK